MKHAVLGCGMMGTAAIYDLTKNPNVTHILAADLDLAKAEAARRWLDDDRIEPVEIDVGKPGETARKLEGVDAILGAVHYKYNVELTRIAINLGAHFCDLGGNNSIVDQQLQLTKAAARAGVSVIPDCGLAPGMVSIVVAHGEKEFHELTDINIRVGGLPQHPKPPLGYKLVFSIEGLINEYIEPVRLIRNGKLETTEPLSELEHVTTFASPFDSLEAFTTSGGTSTLVNTYLGRVRNLDYKTIRYPGHCERIKTLHQLGFFSSEPMEIDDRQITPRSVSGRVLENALSNEDTDVVLVSVELTGKVGPRIKRLLYRLVDSHDTSTGLSAMARCTAFPAIIISQMQAEGKVRAAGALPQELAVPTDIFFEELVKREIKFEEIFEDI